MTYNGWKNYETWVFGLWNDGNFYQEEAKRFLDEAEPVYDWEDKKSRAITDMEDY